jgi:hypothetical protein
MSNRNFDMSYVVGKRLIDIEGSFVPLTGAGIVNAATVKGFGFGYAFINGVMTLQTSARPGINGTPGIVRTGVGTYTITLDDSYADFNIFDANLMLPNASGSQLWAQCVATATNIGVSGQCPVFTLVIVNNSGTPTEAPAGCRLAFLIQLRDSTVQQGKP